MATVTPNFNWPVPTSGDLVKNGATAIEALGDGIDASFVDLKGGTTGQVLSKASNTDLDYSWVTTDDANAIQNAIVNAKGDIIGASANDVPAITSVGSNGQALIADSTASTGLAYGNKGYTLLSSTALSGATVSVTGIPQTYQQLMIIVSGQNNGTTNGKTTVGVNSNTTFCNISGVETGTTSTIAGTAITTAFDKGAVNSIQTMCITIQRYATTLLAKPTQMYGYYVQPGGAGQIMNYAGISYQTGAITSVQVSNTGGIQTAGTVEIWGLN